MGERSRLDVAFAVEADSGLRAERFLGSHLRLISLMTGMLRRFLRAGLAFARRRDEFAVDDHSLSAERIREHDRPGAGSTLKP